MKLSELFEAVEAKFVVAKLSIAYTDRNFLDKEGTVTIYTECSSAEEAAALAKKMVDLDIKDEDLLLHYAQNSFNNFEGIASIGSVDSAKVASKAPATGRKVFYFNPGDLKLKK